MGLSIRSRMTLWYTTVLLVALALFGAWVYVVESRLRLAEIDEQLRRSGTTVAAGVDAEMDEGAGLQEAAAEACKDFAFPGRILAIRDAAGGPLAGATLAASEAVSSGASASSGLTVNRDGAPWRLSVQPHRHGRVEYQVLLAESLAPLSTDRAMLRRTLLVGIPLVLGLAAGGGFWIARRALRPVSLMVGQARRITNATSGLRLRVPHAEDELGVLARAFNELLDRLDGALANQRRFMADASHELRTPLSIVRAAAEVALDREGRSEQEYRESLALIARQTRGLGTLVEEMMTLARADAGGLPLQATDFYLDELLGECVRDARVLACERAVDVRFEDATEAPFRGDERLLRQMLMNLLDNAVRHTPADGEVEARIAASDGWVEITVRDTGCGVARESRERIFERFVRLDPARSRPGGAGLGLPIARCIAEAHGGTLTLAESGPSGSTFRVRIPAPRC